MQVIETKLKGCYIVEPVKFGDSRGYFLKASTNGRLIN